VAGGRRRAVTAAMREQSWRRIRARVEGAGGRVWRVEMRVGARVESGGEGEGEHEPLASCS